MRDGAHRRYVSDRPDRGRATAQFRQLLPRQIAAVSMAVCSSSALAAASSAREKANCANGSPPDRVMPPAGLLIKRQVAAHHGEHFLDRLALSDHLQRARVADLDALPATPARRQVQRMAFSLTSCPPSAHAAAQRPQCTQVGAQPNLRLRLQPFRIMAPQAAQRASLQKDGGADARSIMQGETLDIKIEPSSRMSLSGVCCKSAHAYHENPRR